ncbi:MAG: rhomboid family intramembrane serine protease [Cyanobacteria bacterium P01_A01_bin.45]
MIPISDNVIGRVKPIITSSLIVINIVWFLWELQLEFSGQLKDFIHTWGTNPQQLTTAVSDLFNGNPAAGIIVLISLTSIVTGMFLHASFSQILGNLLFLWVFGKSVEKKLGHRKFLELYIICGTLTGIVQIISAPTSNIPFIGANGAIASILGAYIYKFPKAKVDSILPLVVIFLPIELPATLYLLWWFIQQSFYGIGSLNIPGGVDLSSIGYWLHGAGILIGAAWVQKRLKIT